MKTLLFDCQGTLVGNPTVSEEVMKKVLLVLKATGHRIIVWSAVETLIPDQFAALADECWSKNGRDVEDIDEDFVVFDDDIHFLRYLVRRGCNVVAASQMGEWIAQESWDAPS